LQLAVFSPAMPKFLILRFSSIGDIVLTSPVVRCLKQQVPDAEVHYATKKNYAAVIEHNSFIDKKFYLEESLSDLIIQLKEENYDFIIDLHNNLRTLKIKTRLGVKSYSFDKLNFQKWLMVNFKINKLPPVHIVDRYMETVNPFGVVNDGKGLDYFLGIDEVQNADKVFNQLPLTHRENFIAFVIGAKHNTKQLPAEKIISICEKINQPIVLLGDKTDFAKGVAIVSGLQLQTSNFKPQTFNACGMFSLNESALLLKHASKVITHDTGLMHIAAAFKKPIISIWGNTIPEFGMYPYYGDYHIKNTKYEILGLSCRPCTKLGFKKCPRGHFKCMLQHSEEAIAQTVLSVQ
jgi:ADP-heptose:LPS heptosyltransferase